MDIVKATTLSLTEFTESAESGTVLSEAAKRFFGAGCSDQSSPLTKTGRKEIHLRDLSDLCVRRILKLGALRVLCERLFLRIS